MSTPFGLENGGNNCYFNSLVQGIISCKPFYDLIMEKKPSSGIGGAIYRLMHRVTSSVAEIKRELSKLNKIYNYGNQECAFEAYTFLIESMKDLGVPRLFTNRIRGVIFCSSCKYKCKKVDESLFFIIPVEKKHMTSLQEIFDYKEKIPDYKCDKCKVAGYCIMSSRITMVPKIIVIVLSQYTPNGKHIFALNNNFRIPKIPDGYFDYKKVASIEHSGSNNGGHYICVAERPFGLNIVSGGAKNTLELNVSNINTLVFDDSSVSSCELKNTQNSYILFYI